MSDNESFVISDEEFEARVKKCPPTFAVSKPILKGLYELGDRLIAEQIAKHRPKEATAKVPEC